MVFNSWVRSNMNPKQTPNNLTNLPPKKFTFSHQLTIQFLILILISNNQCYSSTQPTNSAKFILGDRDTLKRVAQKAKLEDVVEHNLSYLALCAIVKNELDVVDWLKYHIYIGFKKVYIYDHGSKPPLFDKLLPFIEDLSVTYQYLVNDWQTDDYLLTRSGAKWNSPQRWAYTHCMRQYRHRHQFIGLIDGDEYAVFWDDQRNVLSDAVPFFKNYEDVGLVQLHWRVFGSSGYDQRPEVSPLIAYTQCAQDESHPEYVQTMAKSFVNTKFFDDWCDVHYCNVAGEVVNTLKQPTHWITKPKLVTWEKGVLHHYHIKSKEDYRVKMKQGFPHARTKERKWEGFYKWDNMTTGNCTYMKAIAQKCCM